MTAVVRFPGPIVRAIVVEQLNRHQWHAVQRGRPVPEGSSEGRVRGVGTYPAAVREACGLADLTGLPVLVEPYGEAAAPLPSPPGAGAYWHQRFRRGRPALDNIRFTRKGGGA